MDTRWILRLTAVAVVAGLGVAGWVLTGQTADAGNPAFTSASGMAVSAGALAAEEEKKEEAKFVGSKKCKMCHMKEHKSWGETPHAKAIESLKPGNEKEAKEKANLDPEKDYSKDKECLVCHVTGMGKPGGFEIKEDEKEMAKMVEDFGMVGCESCHGPGGSYIEVHQKIMKEKTEYTDEDMEKAGTLKGGEEQCKTCHNEKSPTYKEFKYEEAAKTGIHEKQELKYRKAS